MNWININEKVPKIEQPVLLVVDGVTVMGYCHPKSNPVFIKIPQLIPIFEGVTYWQPLPSPIIGAVDEIKFDHGYKTAIDDIYEYILSVKELLEDRK